MSVDFPRRWLALPFVLLGLAAGVALGAPVPASEFLRDLHAGSITSLSLHPNGAAEFGLRGGDPQETRLTLDPGLFTALRSARVTYRVVPDAPASPVGNVISTWLPLVALLGLGVLMFRNQKPGNGVAVPTEFTRSRATQVSEAKISFRDVAGCDEAKEELVEIVDFLRSPARFHEIGARIPHGCLLVGPPGSGKTLLAKAVAGEARVPFFTISGSDFVEMFVGVGAARVRDLFDQAKKAAPCIIFIDEIDAVGRKRGTGLGGGNDEREQTLNQLLVEMDGFETKHDIIILAATNRPDVLDPALLRPGRFDRQVTVDAPDVKGREEILKVHARKKPLEENVDLRVVAKRTPGFVGADLENLLNEAALLAARQGRRKVSLRDLDEAADRVVMGPERKSRVLEDADRRLTAYHEVGHALAATLLPLADRVHKVTIVPRGRAAGFMMPLPGESLHWSKNRLLDAIAVALAGRAAEELVFGDVTTGAQNDFLQATQMARRMVTSWGMSELGLVALSSEGEGFLGAWEQKPFSDDTARLVDGQVNQILTNQYERVKHLLAQHLEAMHTAARHL
ncbi:MAG TPA: ATP-dependent zinc metalloprotease FtsH, partial [Deinococcales bacterium]|nr:ATP-dependent zinc metalloprotease FtsH [Deinococcales bacterium]